MTATDELCRLLDEREVEWSRRATAWRDETIWKDASGKAVCTSQAEGTDAIILKMQVTPAQAVEVTLGQGTCEMEYVDDFMSWHCKACDMMDMAPRNPKPRFCKWCGREVVE